jgi:serine/threonine-protein phosphatase 2A regulatory subunit B''
MTAASIKMDELLVNWLGGDAVYSNIMEWVENYSTMAAADSVVAGDKTDSAASSHSDPNNTVVSQMKALNIGGAAPNNINSSISNNETTTTIKTVPPFYSVRNKLQRLPPRKKNPTSIRNQQQQQQQTTSVPLPILMWSEASSLVEQVFREVGNLEADTGDYSLIPDSFVRVTKEICRFPSYFNSALYQRILDWQEETHHQHLFNNSNIVTMKLFQDYWMMEMEPYDETDRFYRLMKQPNANAIVRDDFLPFLKALLSDHPGLEFLSSHDEFQEKYAISIITRIFYFVNTSHSGSITARQLRRSDLLEAFQVVDEEEDINKIPRYFSYEHFYVLYCRFWELDDDRDYRITRDNLLKYGEHSLSHMIVDRIFEAAPRPFGPEHVQREFLTFEDFIYFMLAEEDKANEVSIRYWFDCLDVDADGKLNNMEMRSFYAVQLHRMQCMGHEIVPFEDMLCQMMVRSGYFGMILLPC